MLDSACASKVCSTFASTEACPSVENLKGQCQKRCLPGTANTPWWSWGESNPRPSTGGRSRYDRSRVCGSWLPHRRVGWARRPRHGVFPPGQRSFTPSAVCPCGLHCFCCRAAVDWPRVPSPVAMTLYCLTRSGGESEIVRVGVSVGAPFWESGQLRSHESSTKRRRRNRSAPWVGGPWATRCWVCSLVKDHAGVIPQTQGTGAP